MEPPSAESPLRDWVQIDLPNGYVAKVHGIIMQGGIQITTPGSPNATDAGYNTSEGNASANASASHNVSATTSAPECVTRFRVTYRNAGQWLDLDDGASFPGNAPALPTAMVTKRFATPVQATAVRLHPLEVHGAANVRMAILIEGSGGRTKGSGESCAWLRSENRFVINTTRPPVVRSYQCI